MAPPPRLLHQFLAVAVLLFLSAVLLLAVSGVHGARHQLAHGGVVEHHVGIGEMQDAVGRRRWWSRTRTVVVVRKFGGHGGHGGGGHGHGWGHGRGHHFYPRTVGGNRHHRRSAAAVTAGLGPPSAVAARALLVAAAAVVLLLPRRL